MPLGSSGPPQKIAFSNDEPPGPIGTDDQTGTAAAELEMTAYPGRFTDAVFAVLNLELEFLPVANGNATQEVQRA